MDNSSLPPAYLCIYGPTASGKSTLGMALAERGDGEIINADSVQFYRDFTIGAAKPSSEERARVPHHLLDIVSWNQEFSAADFSQQGRRVVQEVSQRGKIPLVIGGSGLYLRCLWGEKFHQLPSDAALRLQLETRSSEDLYLELMAKDFVRAKALHPHDRLRIMRSLEVCILSGKAFSCLVAPESAAPFLPRLRIFVNPPKEILDRRIRTRVGEMLAEGFIDEVRGLLHAGCPPESKPLQSIGYRQVQEYLAGRISSQEELQEKIIIATRQYAKHQMTWFKKVARDVVVAENNNAAIEIVEEAIRRSFG